MKIFSKYYTIFLIIILPGTSQIGGAQEITRTFSLQEAKDFALINNLKIRNARLDVENSKQVIMENLSFYLPQINSGLNYTNNLNLPTTLLPAEIVGGPPGEFIEIQFGTQHNANASIAASQVLINVPYIIGLQAASLFNKVSEQSLERTEIEIKELVAQNYYLALLAERTYEIIDSNHQNVIKTISETEKLYNKGFVEEVDVDNLKVSAISLKNSMISAERQIELSYRMLKYQLGIDLNVAIELSEKLEDIILEIDVQQALQDPFNVAGHIEYKILANQEKLAFMNLKKQKFEYLPSLDATFVNQWSAIRDQFNFFDANQSWYYSSVLGFSVNIPIFSGMNKRAKVGERRIEYEQAMNAKKLLADGLILENQQARSDFNSAYEQYLSQKENIKISSKVLEKTRIKVREGMASSLDFTQVNNQYLQTESNYISAVVELLNAKIRLDKAMNRL